MLNKKPTQQISLLKISAIVPLLCAFMFFFNVETRAQDTGSYPASTKFTSDFLKDIGKEPLIIINNKEYSSDELQGKTVRIVEDLSYLSADNAIRKFGDKARDGAIIMKKGEIIDDLQQALRKIDDTDVDVNHQYLMIVDGSKPRFVELEKTTKTEVTTTHVMQDKADEVTSSATITINRSSLDDQNPLYILNGKILKSDFNVMSIDADNIESINVLKGKSAVEKYGEEAQDGAIEITTKNQE